MIRRVSLLRTLLDSGAGLIVAGGMTHAATMSDCWHLQSSSQPGFIVNRVAIGGGIVGIELCGLVGRSLAAGSLHSAVVRRWDEPGGTRDQGRPDQNVPSMKLLTIFTDWLLFTLSTFQQCLVIFWYLLHLCNLATHCCVT